jgi:hypothetical protein
LLLVAARPRCALVLQRVIGIKQIKLSAKDMSTSLIAIKRRAGPGPSLFDLFAKLCCRCLSSNCWERINRVLNSHSKNERWTARAASKLLTSCRRHRARKILPVA